MQTLSPTWSLSANATTKWYVRALPSLTDLAFLLPVFLLFFKLQGTKTLFADGDTGWHIRTGEWILDHHAIPTTDLFSFTKPNQSWFAWEWAWDVLFAAIHGIAGLAGVGLVTVLLLSVLAVLLYTLLRRVSRNDVISFFVTAIAICSSSIHWLARPHLFSLLFTVVFLHLLHTAEEGHLQALYLTPVIMIFWTNLHGGFLAGILLLACYAVGHFLASVITGDWRSALVSSRAYWLALALSTAATFVNPYGWHLHQHIFEYLTDKELLSRISEFQSMSFHAESAPLFEVFLLLASFGAFWNLQQLKLAPVLAILVWGHFALLSGRHIPLFVLIASPSVACLLHHGLARLRQTPRLSEAGITISEICDEFRQMERSPRIHLVSGLAVLVLAALFAAGKEPFTPQFDADSFPAQAIPYVQSGQGKRVFTYDQWGDYLIYRLYPSQRVFFDGRSDFYGIEFVKVNQRIIGAEHDWKTLLQSFAIDTVILKPEAPLSAVLKITPGSKVLFDDGKVIVFRIDGIYQPASSRSRLLATAHIVRKIKKGESHAYIHVAEVLEGRGRTRSC